MRLSFDSMDIRGTVVIGEGEKDEAPMLYNGEVVGSGKGPEMDVAVDPVEGTSLLAFGRPMPLLWFPWLQREQCLILGRPFT